MEATHTQQFSLKKGHVQVVGSKLVITGDTAKKDKWVVLAAAACFTGFILFRIWEMYSGQAAKEDSSGAMTTGLVHVAALFFWWYLSYLKIFHTSTLSEIDLSQIVRAKISHRTSDKTPLIKLYLQNKRYRELLVTPGAIEGFSAWLTANGILVQR